MSLNQGRLSTVLGWLQDLQLAGHYKGKMTYEDQIHYVISLSNLFYLALNKVQVRFKFESEQSKEKSRVRIPGSVGNLLKICQKMVTRNTLLMTSVV